MCVFCEIINGNIPSQVVYENEDVKCIKDIKPAAPVHVLIIPKKHFDDILDLGSSEEGIQTANAVLKAIPEVMKATHIEEGFRVINNCKEYGGQTVMHVHFHILGGTKLDEKVLG
ncbi:MAG TPA: HIT domain-containing protein [Bacillota bacterium]|nr:HIT domain-containing protein [Bacillota bacterium]HPE38912.1 HIT domain-containing protein [Bacillota bacterium]